jgi:hypothetical protein
MSVQHVYPEHPKKKKKKRNGEKNSVKVCHCPDSNKLEQEDNYGDNSCLLTFG